MNVQALIERRRPVARYKALQRPCCLSKAMAASLSRRFRNI